MCYCFSSLIFRLQLVDVIVDVSLFLVLFYKNKKQRFFAYFLETLTGCFRFGFFDAWVAVVTVGTDIVRARLSWQRQRGGMLRATYVSA